MRNLVLCVLTSVVLLAAGCGGHYVVKPLNTTTPTVEGFRYYLPKPYLLVTNVVAPDDQNGGHTVRGESQQQSREGRGNDEEQAQQQVTIKVLYLPDTKEPYVIQTKNHGVGTFDGTLQLTNGWMLTNVNEKADPKVAETLTAISGLITAAMTTTKSVATTHAAAPAPFVYLFEIDTANHRLIQVPTIELNTMLCKGPCGR